MKTKVLCALLAMTLLSACKVEQQYDMGHPVEFIFKTDLHPTSLITRMIGNANSFLVIRSQRNNNVVTLHITGNHSESETITLTTDPENYSVRAMGANNSIVVGCVFGYSLDSSENLCGYVAYDGQCPACLDNFAGTDFPLSFVENGLKMHCAQCARVYNLLSGGLSDDGHRMKTYHARYDAVGQTFRVSNQ